MDSQLDKDKLFAAISFIRRCGATHVQIRFSDDQQPVVWTVVAIFKDDRMEVDSAFEPLRAALRLCERLADGGECQHCHRPVGLEPDSLLTMPFNEVICWYQFDPELKTIRRGCE